MSSVYEKKFQLMGKSSSPVKYSSVSTRYTSLQGFMGGAEGNDQFPRADVLPLDSHQAISLQQLFNSGVNHSDLPSCYGSPRVDKRLGPVKFDLANDLFGWVRNKGEPRKAK